MTYHIQYEKKKQSFLNKLEELNIQAYLFYLQHREKLHYHYLKQKLWKSQLWYQAKQTLIELNEFIYGELTCEHCFGNFYGHNKPRDEQLQKRYKHRICQIHHIHFDYNWEQLFGPGETILVHKHCHKQLTEDFFKSTKPI